MCPILQFLDTLPTVEEVDKRIHDLRDDIRALEAYRNARLSVTSRLPDDILSLLFEYVAAASDSYSPRDFISVSQVCRHWRDIALNTPRMWSYIRIRGKSADFLLDRSQSAPIHLLSLSNHHNYSTIKLVQEHSHRLKSIELWDCSTQLFNTLTQLQLPLLKSLTLELEYDCTMKGRLATSVVPGTAPTLRLISLIDCIFDFDEPIFSHLEQLKIRFRLVSAPLTIPDLFRILGHLKRLDTLELGNVVDGLIEELPDDAMVHLPRLTNLSMRVKDIRSLAILTRLSSPRPARSIKVWVEKRVSGDDLAPVASAIYAMVPMPADCWRVELKSNRLRLGSRETCISIWSGPSKEDDPPFLISVAGPVNFETELKLCSLLPPTARITLIYGQPDPYTDKRLEIEVLSSLHSFLRSLHAVEELHIYRLEVLLDIISDTPQTTEMTRPHLLSFSLPSLRRIRLIETGWPFEGASTIWTKLASILAARRSVGAGIDTLEVPSYSHTLDAEEIELLKKHVANFRYT